MRKPILGLHADYRSLPKMRFRWSRLRMEWGRECWRVDSCGTIRATWWEWEH